jgi:hypothetical protein
MNAFKSAGNAVMAVGKLRNTKNKTHHDFGIPYTNFDQHEKVQAAALLDMLIATATQMMATADESVDDKGRKNKTLQVAKMAGIIEELTGVQGKKGGFKTDMLTDTSEPTVLFAAPLIVQYWRQVKRDMHPYVAPEPEPEPEATEPEPIPTDSDFDDSD